MTPNAGYIKLYRSLLDWEWYNDVNTRLVFLHLLLTANYEDKVWRGVVVRRGQRACSYRGLSQEIGISVQQTRTALNNLKSTQDITHDTTPNFGVITVSNYEKYQAATQSPTTEQQQINTQPNNEITTTKEVKKERSKEENTPPIIPPRGKIPPTVEMVADYCRERGNGIDPQRFVDFYDSKGWVVGKTKMKDWQATVRTWEGRRKEEAGGATEHRPTTKYSNPI